jgi:hypothetical protein
MNGERDILNELEGVVRDRAVKLPEGSYTAQLIVGGKSAIGRKIVYRNWKSSMILLI